MGLGSSRPGGPLPGGRPPLPAPGVRLDPDWRERVGHFAMELAAVRERLEGNGRRGGAGAGLEFVGYRPYRPGEDARHLDQRLLARLGRPFIRVLKREAAELWTLWLDASRSMGCGRPGKLQAACELAGALVAVALRQGAQVRVVVSDSPEGEGARSVEVRRPADQAELWARLEGLEAQGAGGLARLLREEPVAPETGRLVLLGDLQDLEPPEALGLLGPGRELVLLQVLAQDELHPEEGSVVEWLDPEGQGRLRTQLTPPVLEAYGRALAQRQGAWSQLAQHPTVLHGVHLAGAPFEDSLRRVLSP